MPLPLPGPPRKKTTVTSVGEKRGVVIFWGFVNVGFGGGVVGWCTGLVLAGGWLAGARLHEENVGAGTDGCEDDDWDDGEVGAALRGWGAWSG